MNEHEKVLQVRFRSTLNQLVVFFAEAVEETADCLNFKNCRAPRTISSKEVGLTEVYAQHAPADIPIAVELEPVITECEPPEWWDVTREGAIAKLQEQQTNELAQMVAKRLVPAKTNLYLHLRELSPRRLAEIQSYVLTGVPLSEELGRKFGDD